MAAIKLLLFLLCLLPFLFLLWDAFSGNLGANPVEELTHRSGDWTLRMLLVTLAVTPLRRATGYSLLRHRRMLGLFSFFYAIVHLVIYVWIDQVFLWDEIVADIIKRPYITFGFTALVILLPLAVTSMCMSNGRLISISGMSMLTRMLISISGQTIQIHPAPSP